MSILGPTVKRRKPAALRAIHPSRADELEHYRAIRALVRSVQASVRELVLPALPLLLSTSAAPRADDLGDDLQRLWDRLKAALRGTDEPARMAAVAMLEKVQRRHAAAFDSAYGAVLPAINPLAGEPWLRQQMAIAASDNAALISSIPADMVAEVQGIVTRGVLAGAQAKSLAGEIVARFAVAESRAALIASDQVLSWHGSLQMYRQLDAGVASYVWSSSQDERVRPGHRALNGKQIPWKQPPVDDPRTGARHHPGMAVRCRCVATPVVPGLED